MPASELDPVHGCLKIQQLGTRPHSSKKTWRSHTPTDEDATVNKEADPYHAHFNESFRVFQSRKWLPLSQDQVPKPSVTRCRPLSCKSRPTQTLRPSTPGKWDERLKSRPCSASHLLLQRRPDTPRVDHGPFDMLTPRVLAHLVNESRPATPLSAYGDIINEESARKSRKKNKKSGASSKNHKGAVEMRFFDNDGEASLTSGIESDEFGSDIDDCKSSSDEDNDSDSDDNDSISELEKGKEPPVDHNRRAPDLRLRPECLDHIYTPENKRDIAKRFDFDASKCETPVYDFPSPIGPPYNKISFRFHAREGSDWRQTNHAIGANVPKELVAMFDRLLEMEKRQIETEEWEEKRGRQLATANMAAAARRRAASKRLLSGKSSSRGATGNGGGAGCTNSLEHQQNNDGNNNSNNNKRCCHSCLQQACVGDCPEKRHVFARLTASVCGKCCQLLCTGHCSDTGYDLRSRHPRDETSEQITPQPPLSHRYKQCKPCQRRHNAKLINANNVVLGRPTSAFSTFSRGKSSSRPKDLRPKSAQDISETLSKGIERLGLEPVQPTPPPVPKPSRPPSRAGLIPGKTSQSNLSRSLTDLSRKRKRSARARKAGAVP